MNDKNPYDPPARDRARHGDRFWIGALVGCLGAVVLMSLLLVVFGAGLFLFSVQSRQLPVGLEVAPLEDETAEELEELNGEMVDEMHDVEVMPSETD